jgi:hypothetical protein
MNNVGWGDIMKEFIAPVAFYQLTPAQQEKAVSVFVYVILTDIMDGSRTYQDADIQERICKATEDMECLGTPLFLGERLLEDEVLGETIREWARNEAKEMMWNTKDLV